MKIAVSPFAPAAFPEMPPVPGLHLASASAGIRYKGRDDVLMAVLPEGATIAGVFTRSAICGAPVDWCRANLAQGSARAIVVNAGNANVFTGAAGAKATDETASAAAKAVGCGKEEVFLASTGVIGEMLDASKIAAVIPGLVKADNITWETAARAIGTTDTFPKGASAVARIGNTDVTIAGIAKGSGMIAPDMATMLAFVFTDAKLPAEVLQSALNRSVGVSFNCITVDSDTSTSDTLLLAATGAAEHPEIGEFNDANLSDFKEKLTTVLTDLALQVVKDGEGARKFITVSVKGAASNRSAKKIGLSVANSPLVKTAIAGEDANWGRIAMAVGKCGERVQRDSLGISIGGVLVARGGAKVEGYDEAPVAAHLKGDHVDIEIDIGIAWGAATIWTCDLTHAYIDINADYRS
ncbi:MAG: bifunctional glutamate N-acetyltransferase/amino-acid acetyltransferase ArgJ [Rhodospirillales bacterium]